MKYVYNKGGNDWYGQFQICKVGMGHNFPNHLTHTNGKGYNFIGGEINNLIFFTTHHYESRTKNYS